MLLRRRSRKGNALPRPPRVPHRCQPAQPPHRRPPRPFACITAAGGAQSALHGSEGGVPGSHLAFPPPRGGEWPPFRVAVAGRAEWRL